MSIFLNLLGDEGVRWFFIWMAGIMALGGWSLFRARQTWLRQSLVLSMILFVAWSVIWLWVVITTNEDVPDPSWTDYIEDVIAILMFFPAGLFAWFYSIWTDNSWPNGVPMALMFFVLSMDSLFWGFVFVSLYRIIRRYIQKKRFTPPNAAPGQRSIST